LALDADDVKCALDAAHALALEKGWAVSIAVVDDGGHLLGFLRASDATPLSAKIALQKARTAALSRRESKFYEENLKGGRLALLSVPEFTVLEGGVPVIIEHQCGGAIGVSGVKSAEDAEVANAGVQAILARSHA
jgi:uncharacterized protein GlcG (DUF336 family)